MSALISTSDDIKQRAATGSLSIEDAIYFEGPAVLTPRECALDINRHRNTVVRRARLGQLPAFHSPSVKELEMPFERWNGWLLKHYGRPSRFARLRAMS